MVNVVVGNTEDKKSKIRTWVSHISFDFLLGSFTSETAKSLLLPEEKYSPEKILISHHEIFIIFKTNNEAEGFYKWIVSANLEAENSFHNLD